MVHAIGSSITPPASSCQPGAPNVEDGRSILVQLTAQGEGLIERAVTAHAASQQRILASTSAADLAAIDASLSRLLSVLEPVAQN